MAVAEPRQQRLDTINRCLGILSYMLKSGNLAGLTSLNSIAEDILCPILAIILRAPDLKSANVAAANTDTIDLYSSAQHLGVQITTDSSAGKVTSTLAGVPKGQWAGQLERIKFLILTPDQTRREQATKTKWQESAPPGLPFEPDNDVIDGATSLLRLIKPSTDDDLTAISDLLEASVLGKEFRDVAAGAATLTEGQLRYQRESLKYIPELFVEARGAKDLARCFVHPILFVQWLLDELDQLELENYSRALVLAGLEGLAVPDLEQYRNPNSWDKAIEQSKELLTAVTRIGEYLGIVSDGVYDKTGQFQKTVRKERLIYFEETKYSLHSNAYMLIRRLDEIKDALTCVVSRVLVFTTTAGQGKTMFICDLVDRCLSGHGVPTAFLTGHYIAQQGGQPVHSVLERLLFGTAEMTSAELLTLLNAHARRLDKPFVIAIDGLNEHSKTLSFSEQLHRFVTDALPFTNIRFLFTCRSEFYAVRFSSLAAPPVYDVLHRSDEIDWSLRDRRRSQMVDKHFDYFGVADHRVSLEVEKALEQDRILLRLFCEAYGARTGDTSADYIPSLYRLEVFGRYLDSRLSAAAVSRQATTHEPVESARRRLDDTLLEIATQMFATGKFSELPITSLSNERADILDYLLGEEILLRRDLSASGGVLTSVAETISFTFDEFRDFILADYLAHHVFESDPNRFEAAVTQARTDAKPIAEGITRFLFHFARQPGHETLYDTCNRLGLLESAFIPEVFNAPTGTVSADDVKRVSAVLSLYRSTRTHGREREIDYEKNHQAHKAALILVARVNEEVYPQLNLRLLLDVVEKSDPGPWNLITSCFTSHEGFGLVASCEAIGRGVQELAESAKGKQERVEILIRLLVALLPVQDDGSLDTPAFLALDEVFSAHPGLALPAILRGRLSGFKASWPYLWRLAARFAAEPDAYGQMAEYAAIDADAADSLGVEASRYLTEAERAGRERHKMP